MDEGNKHKRAERIWVKEDAEAIVARCEGQKAKFEETTKPSKENPPLLFDLTSLQREAGNKHGYSARRVLQLAQACYDRYKLLTYPRTDSKYLPEDYIDKVRESVLDFAGAKVNSSFPQVYKDSAKWIVDNDRITNTKRVFNTAKVSDHFALSGSCHDSESLSSLELRAGYRRSR